MSIFLVILPTFMVASAYIMYRFTGRRQIMKMDLVQFFYAFVVSPVMFLWIKSFLYFLVRHELNLSLSVGEWFVVDAIFSLLFLYIYAFVVIHSLTKTFHLKYQTDPLYDLFAHSEFFHMDMTHSVIFLGGMLVVTFISLLNLAIPLLTTLPNYPGLYSLSLVSVIAGIVGYIGVWSYESSHLRFQRLMKLCFGIFFLVHMVAYFVVEPSWSLSYLFYWFAFGLFGTAVVLALFAERPEEESRFSQLPFWLNWKKPRGYAKVLHRATKQAVMYVKEKI